jgi:hypothetical protein
LMEEAPYRFASAGGALEAIRSGMRFLAELDAASLPAPVVADVLRTLEKADAVEAVARGRLLCCSTSRTVTKRTGMALSGTGSGSGPG